MISYSICGLLAFLIVGVHKYGVFWSVWLSDAEYLCLCDGSIYFYSQMIETRESNFLVSLFLNLSDPYSHNNRKTWHCEAMCIEKHIFIARTNLILNKGF